MTMPICVVGGLGRMGQRLLALAHEYDLDVAGVLLEPGDPNVGKRLGDLVDKSSFGADLVLTDKASDALCSAKVVVDFATVEGLESRVHAAMEADAAFVCGSTGLDDSQLALLDKASEDIPLLWAPNMSSGVHVLLDLVQRAAKLLPEFEAEIHEIHHNKKADAPSGTALALAEQVRAARQLGPESLRLNRAEGLRAENEIGVVASRGGEVPGEHTVYLFGPGERLELVHRAASRDIFARGALRAAAWIARKPIGRYTMADVLR